MSVTGEGGVKLEKTEEKIHVVAVHLDETYTSLQTCLVFKSVELKLINKTVQLHKLCLLCLKEPYFGIGFAKNNIEYLTSILNTKSFNGKPKTAEKKKFISTCVYKKYCSKLYKFKEEFARIRLENLIFIWTASLI